MLLNCSIKHTIVFDTFAYKETAEDSTRIGILRVIVKATRTNKIEISRELQRKDLAQIFCTDRLLRQDNLLLLLLICSVEILL